MKEKLNLLKEKMAGVCENHFHEFVEVSHYIYSHPELGGEEYESSRYLADYLEAQGFHAAYQRSGGDLL